MLLGVTNVGSKTSEDAKVISLVRLYCWIFCMRVSEEERSVLD